MKFKATVYITRKAGIINPEADAILEVLRFSGCEEGQSVRMGKFFEIELKSNLTADEVHKQLEKACKGLIISPVMEEFSIELEEV